MDIHAVVVRRLKIAVTTCDILRIRNIVDRLKVYNIRIVSI